MNILVRAPNWIGDQILAYPFYYYLRRKYPQARIVTVCVPWVENIQFRGLVDEVRVFRGKGSWDWFRFGRDLGKEFSFDLAITLPDSFTSALFLFSTRAKKRVGYSAEWRDFLLTDVLAAESETEVLHRSLKYLAMVGMSASEKMEWGYEANSAGATDLEIEVESEVLAESGSSLGSLIDASLKKFREDEQWPGKRLEPPRFPYYIIAPGATADSRRWPIENWLDVQRRLKARFPSLRGILVGGPKEAPIAERLVRESGEELEDWTVRGSIPELASLFRGAEFALTNESGLAHVAALFCKFTQIVCGAADPKRTQPIGPGYVQVAINAVSCWPCEKNVCMQPPALNIQCLRGISVDEICSQVEQGLLRLKIATNSVKN